LLRWTERSRRRTAFRDLADDPHLLNDIGFTRREAMEEADEPLVMTDIGPSGRRFVDPTRWPEIADVPGEGNRGLGRRASRLRSTIFD